jgi:Flp pilus assembly protein TadD
MKSNLRVLAIGILSSILVTGCASIEKIGNDIGTPVALQPFSASTSTLPASNTATQTSPDVTQSISIPGDKPLVEAQRHFYQREYGLSEKLFRQATLENPKSLDAWLGLAASYDKLKRFDLANRAYRQSVKLGGRTPTILNNWGYSYLLRGNVVEARKKFLAAYELEPKNIAVNANLNLLREGIKRNRRKKT